MEKKEDANWRETLGIRFVSTCPDFQKFLEALMEDGELKTNDIERNYGTFWGKIIEFKNNGFMYIVAKTDGNRPQKFLWLDYFDGSENIISNFEEYIDNEVKIEFQKLEVFVPEAGDYFEVKKIISLSVQ